MTWYWPLVLVTKLTTGWHHCVSRVGYVIGSSSSLSKSHQHLLLYTDILYTDILYTHCFHLHVLYYMLCNLRKLHGIGMVRLTWCQCWLQSLHTMLITFGGYCYSAYVFIVAFACFEQINFLICYNLEYLLTIGTVDEVSCLTHYAVTHLISCCLQHLIMLFVVWVRACCRFSAHIKWAFSTRGIL